MAAKTVSSLRPSPVLPKLCSFVRSVLVLFMPTKRLDNNCWNVPNRTNNLIAPTSSWADFFLHLK